MATLEALAIPAIVALLTLGSSGVSGDDGDLSATIGETVHIPCDFGEGTLRNIYWYHKDAEGPVLILRLFKGNVTVSEEYTDRASLHDDSSTLILSDVAVKDEGTYRCDVEREGQTAVPNINTELQVFSLTSSSLPSILLCQQTVQRPRNCNLTSNGPMDIFCFLHGVYPTTDVSLRWYDEGHGHRNSNFTISQAGEDGTFNVENKLKVSMTGTWKCLASYMSADGVEQSEASVFVKIIDSGDVPECSPNLVAIIVPIVVVVAVVIFVVVYELWRKQKRRKQGKRRYREEECVALGGKREDIDDEKLANIAEAVQDEGDLSKLGRNLGFRQFKINQILQVNERNKDTFATTSMLFEWKKKTPPAKQIPAMIKALEKVGLESVITENFPDEAGISDEKLTELVNNLDHVDDEDAIGQLALNFGFRQFKVNQYLKINKDHGDHTGTLDMLQDWKKKTPRIRQIPDLVEALKNSNLDGSWNNNREDQDK